MRTTICMLCMASLLAVACVESAEETVKREMAEQQRMMLEDSLAFKIAVMPTLDCLPFYVAMDCGLIDTSKVDVRLVTYMAQMDCDTAIANNRVEMAISDLVRVERMKNQGIALDYFSATDAHWSLMANRRADVKSVRNLKGKMMAMTRYSATDMLSTIALDSARMGEDDVFKVQINDVNIRLQMLRNNEIDALWTTEPFTTMARIDSNQVMMSSKAKGLCLGVIAIRSDIVGDSTRTEQLETVSSAYNAACDTINQMGIRHLSNVISKYYCITSNVIDSLSDGTAYHHIALPSEQTISSVRQWLSENDTMAAGPDSIAAHTASKNCVVDTLTTHE